MVRKLIAVHRRGVDYIYAHHDEAMRSMPRSGSRSRTRSRPTSRIFRLRGRMVAGRIRQGSARQDVRRAPIDRRIQRTGGLEGRHRPALPAEGLAEAALTKRNSTAGRRETRVVSLDRFGVWPALEVLCRAGHASTASDHDPAERDGRPRSGTSCAAAGSTQTSLFTLFNTAAAIAARDRGRLLRRRAACMRCRGCGGRSSRCCRPITRSRPSCSIRC